MSAKQETNQPIPELLAAGAAQRGKSDPNSGPATVAPKNPSNGAVPPMEGPPYWPDMQLIELSRIETSTDEQLNAAILRERAELISLFDKNIYEEEKNRVWNHIFTGEPQDEDLYNRYKTAKKAYETHGTTITERLARKFMPVGTELLGPEHTAEQAEARYNQVVSAIEELAARRVIAQIAKTDDFNKGRAKAFETLYTLNNLEITAETFLQVLTLDPKLFGETPGETQLKTVLQALIGTGTEGRISPLLAQGSRLRAFAWITPIRMTQFHFEQLVGKASKENGASKRLRPLALTPGKDYEELLGINSTDVGNHQAMQLANEVDKILSHWIKVTDDEQIQCIEPRSILEIVYQTDAAKRFPIVRQMWGALAMLHALRIEELQLVATTDSQLRNGNMSDPERAKKRISSNLLAHTPTLTEAIKATLNTFPLDLVEPTLSAVNPIATGHAVSQRTARQVATTTMDEQGMVPLLESVTHAYLRVDRHQQLTEQTTAQMEAEQQNLNTEAEAALQAIADITQALIAQRTSQHNTIESRLQNKLAQKSAALGKSRIDLEDTVVARQEGALSYLLTTVHNWALELIDKLQPPKKAIGSKEESKEVLLEGVVRLTKDLDTLRQKLDKTIGEIEKQGETDATLVAVKNGKQREELEANQVRTKEKLEKQADLLTDKFESLKQATPAQLQAYFEGLGFETALAESLAHYFANHFLDESLASVAASGQTQFTPRLRTTIQGCLTPLKNALLPQQDWESVVKEAGRLEQMDNRSEQETLQLAVLIHIMEQVDQALTPEEREVRDALVEAVTTRYPDRQLQTSQRMALARICQDFCADQVVPVIEEKLWQTLGIDADVIKALKEAELEYRERHTDYEFVVAKLAGYILKAESPTQTTLKLLTILDDTKPLSDWPEELQPLLKTMLQLHGYQEPKSELDSTESRLKSPERQLQKDQALNELRRLLWAVILPYVPKRVDRSPSQGVLNYLITPYGGNPGDVKELGEAVMPTALETPIHAKTLQPLGRLSWLDQRHLVGDVMNQRYQPPLPNGSLSDSEFSRTPEGYLSGLQYAIEGFVREVPIGMAAPADWLLPSINKLFWFLSQDARFAGPRGWEVVCHAFNEQRLERLHNQVLGAKSGIDTLTNEASPANAKDHDWKLAQTLFVGLIKEYEDSILLPYNRDPLYLTGIKAEIAGLYAHVIGNVHRTIDQGETAKETEKKQHVSLINHYGVDRFMTDQLNNLVLRLNERGHSEQIFDIMQGVVFAAFEQDLRQLPKDVYLFSSNQASIALRRLVTNGIHACVPSAVLNGERLPETTYSYRLLQDLATILTKALEIGAEADGISDDIREALQGNDAFNPVVAMTAMYALLGDRKVPLPPKTLIALTDNLTEFSGWRVINPGTPLDRVKRLPEIRAKLIQDWLEARLPAFRTASSRTVNAAVQDLDYMTCHDQDEKIQHYFAQKQIPISEADLKALKAAVLPPIFPIQAGIGDILPHLDERLPGNLFPYQLAYLIKLYNTRSLQSEALARASVEAKHQRASEVNEGVTPADAGVDGLDTLTVGETQIQGSINYGVVANAEQAYGLTKEALANAASPSLEAVLSGALVDAATLAGLHKLLGSNIKIADLFACLQLALVHFGKDPEKKAYAFVGSYERLEDLKSWFNNEMRVRRKTGPWEDNRAVWITPDKWQQIVDGTPKKIMESVQSKYRRVHPQIVDKDPETRLAGLVHLYVNTNAQLLTEGIPGLHSPLTKDNPLGLSLYRLFQKDPEGACELLAYALETPMLQLDDPQQGLLWTLKNGEVMLQECYQNHYGRGIAAEDRYKRLFPWPQDQQEVLNSLSSDLREELFRMALYEGGRFDWSRLNWSDNQIAEKEYTILRQTFHLSLQLDKLRGLFEQRRLDVHKSNILRAYEQFVLDRAITLDDVKYYAALQWPDDKAAQIYFLQGLYFAVEKLPSGVPLAAHFDTLLAFADATKPFPRAEVLERARKMREKYADPGN